MKGLTALSLVILAGCVGIPRQKSFQISDLEGKWVGTYKSFAASKEGEISAEFKRNSVKKWIVIIKNAYLNVSGGVITVNLEEKNEGTLSGNFMGGTFDLTVNGGKLAFSASHLQSGSVFAKGTATEEELDGTYETKSEQVGDSTGGFNLKRTKN